MPAVHAVVVHLRLAVVLRRSRFQAVRVRLRDIKKVFGPLFGPSTWRQKMGKQDENDRSASTCAIR